MENQIIDAITEFISKDIRLSLPFFEIVARGALVYLGIFFLFRLILKREAGTIAMSDLIVVVLLGDAAQNAMASDNKTIADGFVLIATLLGCAYLIDWIPFRFPSLTKMFHPSPLLLVDEGKLIRNNMKKELITFDELLHHMRLQGVEELSEVKKAYIEEDGRISVISTNKEQKVEEQQQAF